ncbi:MAG: hypothetical protein KKA73_09210 [Chloroflexi bacterium]|nr:hypothetical protein [Chloroflexota bacterium]
MLFVWNIAQYVRGRLIAGERGEVTLEWIIVAALVLAIVGMSVIAVLQALAGRFEALAGSL